MTTEISHISVQYSKTIGRGEQFGPGFNYPVHVARGKEGIMYVLCRGSEFRPEGVRVTVCTTDEEYVSTFARGVTYQGPHEWLPFPNARLSWACRSGSVGRLLESWGKYGTACRGLIF